MNFIEFQMWGLNAPTVGFLGTLVFTTTSFLAQAAQCRTLYAKKSGESLATSFYLYWFTHCVVCLQYGLGLNRLALIYSSTLLMGICGLICFGLWQFKGFGLLDWLTLSIGLITGSVMYFLPRHAIQATVYGLSLFGLLLWSMTQPLELWKTKHPGVVRIEPVIMSALSVTFWIIYGYATGDRVMKVVCPLLLVNTLLTMALWMRYGGNLAAAFKRGD